MSFNDMRGSVIPPPLHSYGANGDASGCWSQYPRNDLFDPQSQFEVQQPPFKRARNFEENQSSPMPYPNPPSNSRVQPPNAPMNKGINNIFFKTRMCAKFKLGLCRNGASCNFAHGVEDMRQPPPNWQEIVGIREDDQSVSNWNDDQKIIQKMKLCRKFYNGEECPYGDRCNFLHEDPAKFRDDSGRFRESSAISIGTTGTPLINGSDSSYPEPIKAASSSVPDALRANGNSRPSFWKTKLCTKWEITGHCPFGEKCHFAHGQSELQLSIGREGEVSNTALNVKPLVVAMEAPSSLATSVPSSALPEGQAKQSLLKWKGPKKINRIYADWLDDLPLSPSSTSQLEG
ncbi:zinc finger CCCH domain-containing protein 39-like [Cucurbita moschata]|uniref:Zinc finger CCCH domain-containing protein 39-like n=1 Tax=Cucurbita moschata TaxID=3662 RepID=A0A6J1G2M8_CUCMO|nr:zinc finger CCCH domain-containing protein 39-like [Cucurbita moschata]